MTMATTQQHQQPTGKPLSRCESLPVLPSESDYSCCYCLVELDKVAVAPKKSSLKVKSQSESLQRDSIRSSTSSATSVSFTSVETREYPYLLGCNPSVSKGLPLTIGWCPVSTDVQSIDDFEQSRGRRRNAMFLRLPKSKREESLRLAGYTTEDLEQVLEEIAHIRQSRETSKQDEVSELKRLMEEARRKKTERKSRKKRGLRRIMSWSS